MMDLGCRAYAMGDDNRTETPLKRKTDDHEYYCGSRVIENPGSESALEMRILFLD
jgi:hypothetical protein